MSEGLKTTFELLAKTKNEAAARALVPALDSSSPAIQEGALRAILDRRSQIGQREILRRLHKIDDSWRTIIEQKPGRMNHALRDALLSSNAQLCANACKAIVWLHEYDLAPTLITALEDEANASADLAAETLLTLSHLLYEELAAPRDYRNRRDPQIVRRNVLGSLEQSVKRYAKHKRDAVIEAFLMIVNRDNATLAQNLIDPNQAAYLTVLDLLGHSEHGGVIRLLLSFLDDSHPPSAAINVLAERRDGKFLQHLLERFDDDLSSVVKQNIKRVENFAWMSSDLDYTEELDDHGQRRLMRLLVVSGAKRTYVFRMIEHLLAKGRPGGRRAAAQALTEFTGGEANALALTALGDEDPEVQAIALRQLRNRGIPGALPQLIEMLDSPHEVVRQAARENLGEFSFPRFMAAYDTLDERARQSTGHLVKKVDPETASLLMKELRSPARTRRLRALDVAMTMEVVCEVEEAVIELLSDDDYVVRIEAASALAQSDSLLARQALETALSDKSQLVQEAADRALQSLALLPDVSLDAHHEVRSREPAHD